MESFRPLYSDATIYYLRPRPTNTSPNFLLDDMHEKQCVTCACNSHYCVVFLHSGPSVAIYAATERFAVPSGVFTVSEMKCTGNEGDVDDCPATMGSSCQSVGNVAGVYCFNTPSSGTRL